jgi:mono/diheme cytochrome c family protein
MKQLALLLAVFSLTATTSLAVDKKIERLWKKKCNSCHGADGKAETEKGKKMKMHSIADEEWQKKNSDDDIKKVINEGVKEEKDGVKKEMDAYKEDLKPEELDGLLQFIRELKK